MSKLTLFSVRNRALIALATVFTLAAGLFSATTLPRELFPSLQFPVLVVSTAAPGSSSEVVESQVTEPVEAAAQGLADVTEVQSTSSEGFSAVTIELDYGTDLGNAQTELQRAVLSVRGLPDDADPQVFAGNIDDFPIIQLAATNGSNSADLVDRLERSVVPELEDIDGVRDVQITGTSDRIVSVDLDEQAATQAGVSAASVGQALQANGVVVPAGTVLEDGAGSTELSVQVGSRLTSVEEIEALPLGGMPAAAGTPTQADAPTEAGTSTDRRPVTIGAVADVQLDERERTAYTRTNGDPSVGLAITKTPDGNAVDISHALEELRPQLEAALDGGTITVITDTAPFIEQSIEDLATEGVLGLGFAVLVVLVFLLSVRLTLVTALSIPLSLLIALIGLQASGYTLNILTLGALTISIGRVVDDSIVVTENIKRHLALGQDRRHAVVEGVREVAGAITSATVATVAVFLPLGFVGGQVGELFRPFALTVAFAMGASLLVALTIIPVLGYWFLGRSGGRGRRARDVEDADAPDRLQRAYLPVLRTTLRRPLLTLVAAAVVLAGTGAAATQLKTDFIGSSGEDTLAATLTLPTGTTLEETDAASRDVEAWLAQQDQVEDYQATVGSSGGIESVFLGGGENTASYSVALAEGTDPDVFGEQLSAAVDVPEDASFSIAASAQQPGSSTVQVVVSAQDREDLTTAAEAVTAEVREADVSEVSSNLTDTVPALRVNVDREAATAAGLSEAQVGEIVAAATNGSTVGEVNLDTAPVPVVVSQGEAPDDVDALEALTIGPATSPEGPLTLGDVASLDQVDEPVQITRVDGIRSATIEATPTGDNLGALTADLQQRLDGLELPEGVQAELGGVSADQEDAFASLGLALLAAIAIVYLVMVATFNSLVQPLILMVSVPFAATGSLALLLLTGTPLDVAAMIGMLMLVGIVVTNAIVLIDLVNQYRNQGMARTEAVLEGARHRFRPIVMTALATILALTPMALAVTGGGAFISQPLAIVVIGGLLSSTVLTLVLVPVLYELVGRVGSWWQERRARRGGRHEAHPPPSTLASGASAQP